MNLPSRFLPYGHQSIGEDDLAAVSAVLGGEWLTTGPSVGAFEEVIANKVGAKYAVACSSGTAALHLATMAAGISAKDAVIVQSVTFVATANCADYVGARVVFADVDKVTGLMGLEHLDEALARADAEGLEVKAVLPVHLNGQICPMPNIRMRAQERHLVVIEDACHAL